MSDDIKHECGLAFIRLRKPFSYYLQKHGSVTYGLNKLYLLMEKQHNRGQDGAGVANIKLDMLPGERYISRYRSIKKSPIQDIFDHINDRFKQLHDENPDSLFWKIDFLLKHQPDWLKPNYVRRNFHFGNKDNGSTINGVATTTGAGIGGRCTAMFVDEFSRIETPKAAAVLSGTADTTRCRIFNYTYWGPKSHPSYELAERKDIRQLRLHWTLHPEKRVGLYHYDDSLKRVVVDDPGYEFDPDYIHVKDGKTRSPWYDSEERRRNDPQGMALDVEGEHRRADHRARRSGDPRPHHGRAG